MNINQLNEKMLNIYSKSNMKLAAILCLFDYSLIPYYLKLTTPKGKLFGMFLLGYFIK